MKSWIPENLNGVSISRFLVTAAIFLVFSNVAIASETFSDKSKASVVDYLQQDDNNKPFVFNEISIGEGSQSVSQNESLGTGFTGIFYSSKDFLLLLFPHHLFVPIL